MNDSINKAALVLKAVTNKNRIKIMDFLRDKGRSTVTEIYIGLRLEQSIASQHLGVLRRAGVVKAIRDGKFIYYSLCDPRINRITELSAQIVGTSSKDMTDEDNS